PTSQKRDAHPGQQAGRGPRDVGHPGVRPERCRPRQCADWRGRGSGIAPETTRRAPAHRKAERGCAGFPTATGGVATDGYAANGTRDGPPGWRRGARCEVERRWSFCVRYKVLGTRFEIGIFDRDEEEAGGGRSGTGRGAVAGGEQGGDGVGQEAVRAGLDKGSDQVAHHVVEKSVGGDAVEEEVVRGAPLRVG